MDEILIGVIVTGAVIWACRSAYKMFTGKGGCNCSGRSCSDSDKCDEFSEDDNA